MYVFLFKSRQLVFYANQCASLTDQIPIQLQKEGEKKRRRREAASPLRLLHRGDDPVQVARDPRVYAGELRASAVHREGHDADDVVPFVACEVVEGPAAVALEEERRGGGGGEAGDQNVMLCSLTRSLQKGSDGVWFRTRTL